MSLFQPKWKNMDSGTACDAVRKLSDQAEIACAAREAPDFHARLIAVEMLTSQDVLADVAQTDETYYIRMAAADKLNDRDTAERVYMYIALDDGEGVRVTSQTFRAAAAERMCNPIFLREIASKLSPKKHIVLDAVKQRLAELNGGVSMANNTACSLSACGLREGCPGAADCLKMTEFWNLMPPLSVGKTYSDFMTGLVPCFINDEDFVFSISGMEDGPLLKMLVGEYHPLISGRLEEVFGKKFNIAFSVAGSV